MKFLKKASTSSPPPTELKEEVPKKIPISIIKKIFSFERLEMRFLWWIFLASMVWGLYFISPLSKPKEIYVYGNRQVELETIQEQAGIKKGKSIWGILSEHEIIRKRLTSRNPKIKDVSVTLSGMNSIQLTILENPAIGYYVQDEQYKELLADAQSISVEELTNKEKYPELVNFTEESRIQLANQLEKTSPSVISNIRQIQYVDPEQKPLKLHLKMKDGMKVIGTLKDIGEKLNYYPSILKQLPKKSGTIDMEVGIFYTPDVNAQ